MAKDEKPNQDDSDANIFDKESVQPQRLIFSSDNGASRPTWFAALLVLFIVGWVASGFITPLTVASQVLQQSPLVSQLK